MKDALRTSNFWDKLRIWFMPTGWRPSDVKEKFPIEIIDDVYNFKRYETPASKGLKIYVILQMLISVVLLLFMFYNYSSIGFTNLLIFGAFIFFGIFSYSLLMDRLRIAALSEGFRAIFGIVYILVATDWFGLNTYISSGSILMIIYFTITLIAGLYFTYIDGKEFLNKPLVN